MIVPSSVCFFLGRVQVGKFGSTCTIFRTLFLFVTVSQIFFVSADSFSPQPETEPQTDNKKKIFLGNLPADVQKYQIDQLVRFIHGVMSYRLRQHKDKKNDL